MPQGKAAAAAGFSAAVTAAGSRSSAAAAKQRKPIMPQASSILRMDDRASAADGEFLCPCRADELASADEMNAHILNAHPSNLSRLRLHMQPHFSTTQQLLPTLCAASTHMAPVSENGAVAPAAVEQLFRRASLSTGRESSGTVMAMGTGLVSMMALSKPLDVMLGDCYLGSLEGSRWLVLCGNFIVRVCAGAG